MGCFSARDTSPRSPRPHHTLKSLLHRRHAPSSDKILTPVPSFRARAIHGASRLVKKQHPRALSAPSCSSRLHGDDTTIAYSAPLSVDFWGTDVVSSSAERSTNHLFPLPPPPDDSVTCSQSTSSTGSGSSSTSSNSTANRSSKTNLSTSASSRDGVATESQHRPLPLPPPPDSGAVLREFSFEELAGACLNFAPEFWIREGGAGPVFRAIVKNASVEEEKTLEVEVMRLLRVRPQSLRKWRAQVTSLSRLSHPHLCKVLGFSTEDPSTPRDKAAIFQRERLLVYEHTPNGSLESLLYGRTDKAPLNWFSRLKIATGAAQGLAFLHDRTPRQILYRSFKTLNIQVDKDFVAKLSDYGFATSIQEELPYTSPARALALDDAYSAPETRLRDELSPKSNVWSFGIVLLELLTGRQNMDEMFPLQERNLLEWSKPNLRNAKKLYLIMDPELKGRYPTRSAKMLADLALQCLSEDPSARPTMNEIVVTLSSNPISRGDPPSTTNINSFKSKAYNLSSVLGSPARSEPHRIGFRGFLSGEITNRSMASREYVRHPISRYGFLSGEILQGARSPVTKDYQPPPLGRSISSGMTVVTG